ncbi:hypothetical protein [Mastigocoleus testarum]|uniref:Uncharacterized protein n=1 Tax=Mastigocoleus testarum BC008 TaxID=371196 RepID=A0A0V7ZBR6_9CYAN|nr:hypothetical protein [Mastigocoleus testarum]KST61959.1 hypothetical protein BC008_07955 [Mastigocoleus testarum BC008]
MPQIERESINFKLPKTLTSALRLAARKRETTATDLVIQGLHHILGDVPGVEASVEVRLYQLEEEFFRFKESVKESIGEDTNSYDKVRLTNVENKIEALSHQLARLEGALMQIQSSVNTLQVRSRSHSSGASRYKSGGYPYQYNSQPPQLEPLDEDKLAMRLSTNAPTVQERRETMTKKEFERWCSERDPSKRKWKYNSKDRLYHPVK